MKKLLLVICCLGCLLSVTGCGDKKEIKPSENSGNSETKVREKDKYSEEEYKSLCEKVDYKTIARNPDANYLKKVYGTGEIVQVVEEDGEYAAFRVDITPEMDYEGKEVLYYKDTVLLYTYDYDKNNKLLEEDIINFWGLVSKEFTYETIFGSSETIPSIQMDYFELNE